MMMAISSLRIHDGPCKAALKHRSGLDASCEGASTLLPLHCYHQLSLLR